MRFGKSCCGFAKTVVSAVDASALESNAVGGAPPGWATYRTPPVRASMRKYSNSSGRPGCVVTPMPIIRSGDATVQTSRKALAPRSPPQHPASQPKRSATVPAGGSEAVGATSSSKPPATDSPFIRVPPVEAGIVADPPRHVLEKSDGGAVTRYADGRVSLAIPGLVRPDGTVGRGAYVAVGVVLFAVKHNLDRLVASAVFHRPWGLFNYVVPPEGGVPLTALDASAWTFYSTLVALALPFIAVGVWLTLGR